MQKDNKDLFHQNARLLHLHYKDLSYGHTVDTSHIISVPESWLTISDSSDRYSMPGYRISRNDQKQAGTINRPPRGLAAYVRNDVTITYFAHHSSKDSESSVLVFL